MKIVCIFEKNINLNLDFFLTSSPLKLFIYQILVIFGIQFYPKHQRSVLKNFHSFEEKILKFLWILKILPIISTSRWQNFYKVKLSKILMLVDITSIFVLVGRSVLNICACHFLHFLNKAQDYWILSEGW